MKVYQINYDLRNQRNYQDLITKIKSYGTWAKPLESCWLIATEQSASQIRDTLASVMDNDDGLLVTRLQGEAAWRSLDYDIDSTMTNWLKEQLKQAA
ncbi:CRISPR-associated protein Cas2 [Alteromonas sp. 1_MG-2023]|uniref:CRISPR-associated protein Cas2 n=1 Tax=Alteromonas sp. 1_MG-2023 TaxID=3062669 RepID=UPI0026E15101|nr:CRISPR-associated protein Cas2 [Alteromonas sp. 1_MG-2023]MDO6568618.1 CRISPR-associated protein Cas2 [Alteromonas sp. 1_MG-2023]